MTDNTLLKVENLKVNFFTHEGVVKAVQGISFSIERGNVLGIVGESGSGKSVMSQSILRIVPPPGKVVEGKITFHHRVIDDNLTEVVEEVNLTELDPRSSEMRAIRGAEIAMVFQEPMTSLNPLYTLGDHLLEAITLHQDVGKKEGRKRAIDILRRVGMAQPERTIDSYPHQLSGGMRQRAMIAIALSCNPSLLIADEPTTALDVTTEAQILSLMRNLQQELGTAILYITHDLGVVAEMCDEVIVMYLGRVVEKADVDTIFYDPKHPYTRALLRSMPRVSSNTDGPLETIKGSVPDTFNHPKGCAFWPRCPEHMPGVCDVQEPQYTPLEPKHHVRCHLYEQVQVSVS